ncbi:MAG TPA: type III secretion system export apparatus subunit SctT [Trinickia sp.]|jgi:type III secretion protein T|nr:type III secretion system export apparatus subunit SctT [Trinickia sp.]
MSEITFQSLQSSHHLGGYIALLALYSERLIVLMLIFPPTSDSVMQGTVRMALSLMWGTFIAYGQQATIADLSPMMLIAIGVKEALLGIVLGYAASAVFWAAQSVGTYIDDLSGFNQVQLQNPSDGQQTSLTSTLLSQFAIAAFWVLGGMTFLLGAVYESYRWWPLADFTPAGGQILESFVLQKTDSLMETVAKLATPMMFLLLLVDIGFGFTSKVSQKLNLSSMSQPVKGALTVLMLALMAGVFIDQVRDQLSLTGIAAEARALAGHR